MRDCGADAAPAGASLYASRAASLRRSAPLGQLWVRGQDNGGSAFTGAIKATLRAETENAELSSKALASYLLGYANSLDQQPFASLRGGQLEFPDVTKSR